jgi:phage tail-like protein
VRDRPFLNCNFLVDLGTGTTDGAEAGFQEISPIALEVTVAEYRNGNEKENNPRLLTGATKSGTVTLRRGIIGAGNLYAWIDPIRNGDQNALRTVLITLVSEDHATVVQRWKLLRARPVRVAAGPFHAQATEIAIEELVLAYERLEIEV